MKSKNMYSLSSLLLATAVTLSVSARAAEPAPSPTAGQQAKEGWQDVKKGTKELAAGAGTAAENAGKDVAAGAKKLGNKIKATTCPVVGNQATKKYYTSADKDYPRILDGEKVFDTDLRECFLSETAAAEKGFKRVGG